MWEFLDNPAPDKRDQLIEVLFNSPEYVDYWTYRLADLFRVAMYRSGKRITRSRTYQLSGRTNHTNRNDRTNYSEALPRPLDAEVVLDAISQVTASVKTSSTGTREGTTRHAGH